MANILLAIRPEFVKLILSGRKQFEFRKHIPKQFVEKIFIYETAPTKKVVAVADIVEIVSGVPEDVWNITQNAAGISRDFFDYYFNGFAQAYAYKIGNIVQFDVPKKLSDFGINVAPQNFVYVDKNMIFKYNKKKDG